MIGDREARPSTTVAVASATLATALNNLPVEPQAAWTCRACDSEIHTCGDGGDPGAGWITILGRQSDPSPSVALASLIAPVSGIAQSEPRSWIFCVIAICSVSIVLSCDCIASTAVPMSEMAAPQAALNTPIPTGMPTTVHAPATARRAPITNAPRRTTW